MAMTTNIHKNTAAKAKKHGIDIQFDDEEKTFLFFKNDEQIAANGNPAKGLDEAIQFLDSGTAERQEEATKTARTNARKASKANKPKKAVKKNGAEDGEEGDEGEGDEGDGDDGEESPAAAGSIVKPKYRKEYGKERHNHDPLAVAISTFVRDDKGNLNVANLEALAKENDVDLRPWEELNNGQRSMNLRNVLRGRWKKGEIVKVDGEVIAH